MKPGPEMDRAVLEKVFGYKWGKIGDRDQAYMPHGYSCSGPDVFCNRKSWVDLPNFSTDMSAAWKVVEVLVHNNQFSLVSSRISAGKFGASFNGSLSLYEWGDTAPEAICRAALKACERNK